MSTRVIEAIVSLWDSESLDSTFPGGLWFEVAPPGTEYPFVQVASLGNVPGMWTSTSEHREQRYQMSIFYEEATGTDPASALGTLMRVLDDAFCHASLSIPSSAGHVYDVIRTRDDINLDKETRIWVGVIDYLVRRRLPVSYS